MAIPKTLNKITKEKALSIIHKHSEGEWDGIPFQNGDFLYEGRKTKWGKRMEMIRVFDNGCFQTYEQGIVAN